MTFFDRYAQLCRERGIDPCGQKAEALIGINKTTANKWNVNGTTPKGDTVRQLADFFEVSADYLLGRTPARTDFTREKPAEDSPWEEMRKVYESLPPEDQKEILAYAQFKAASNR